MKGVLVSACLLSLPCRYDGRASACEGIEKLCAIARVVPFCPEVYAGLPTPRESAEIRGERVYAKSGADVTLAFREGARQAVCLARALGCAYALLKDNSPSCGAGRVYDGSFTGAKIAGDGFAARALKRAGARVFAASEIEALLRALAQEP